MEKEELFKLFTTEDGIRLQLREDIVEPTKCYKYFSLTDYSIKNIENSTLHFSHVNTLNDILDGNPKRWDLNNFISTYIEDTGNSRNRNDLDNKIRNELTKLFDYIGIMSVCESVSNELIWVHYTQDSGFCVEIDMDKLKIELTKNPILFDIRFFPIEYPKLQQINLANHLKVEITAGNDGRKRKHHDANIPILYCLSKKDECWKYEQEWRILLKGKNFTHIKEITTIISENEKASEHTRKKVRNIYVSKESFTKIILAPQFFNNSRFNKNIGDIYYFTHSSEGIAVREFLKVCKEKYNDKIFQVQKLLHEGVFIRKIIFKILIVSITDNYAEIRITKIS